MQYHPFSHTISKIIKKHWDLLRISYPMVQEFWSLPMSSDRKDRTIHDRLINKINFT